MGRSIVRANEAPPSGTATRIAALSQQSGEVNAALARPLPVQGSRPLMNSKSPSIAGFADPPEFPEKTRHSSRNPQRQSETPPAIVGIPGALAFQQGPCQTQDCPVTVRMRAGITCVP